MIGPALTARASRAERSETDLAERPAGREDADRPLTWPPDRSAWRCALVVPCQHHDAEAGRPCWALPAEAGALCGPRVTAALSPAVTKAASMAPRLDRRRSP